MSWSCLDPNLSSRVNVSSGAVLTSSVCLPAVAVQSSESNRTPVQPSCEKTDGSESGAPVTSARKWQFSSQLSRNKETTCSRVDDNLTEHQIFVSIQGNQFKRNGLGNFGTFFYWWLPTFSENPSQLNFNSKCVQRSWPLRFREMLFILMFF